MRLFILLLAAIASSTQPTQQHASFHRTIPTSFGYDYAISLPPGYAPQPHKKYPLIIYLHGSGNCGTDLTMIDATPVLKHARATADFPFVIVAPQLPTTSEWWQPASLNVLLDHVLEKYD